MAAPGFKVEVLSKPLRRALESMPEALDKSLTVALKIIGKNFTLHMKQFQLGAGKGGPFRKTIGKGRLASRSKRLSGSIGFKVLGSVKSGDRRLRVYAGNALTPYAEIQETGGTIRGNPWLTIPLPDNIIGRGQRFPSAAALRDDSTFGSFILRKNGGLVIYGYREDESNIVPGKEIAALWVLKRSVKLTARLGFNRTWRSNRQRKMRKRVLTEYLQPAVDVVAKRTGKG